jgi:hypothetical protein
MSLDPEFDKRLWIKLYYLMQGSMLKLFDIMAGMLIFSAALLYETSFEEE